MVIDRGARLWNSYSLISFVTKAWVMNDVDWFEQNNFNLLRIRVELSGSWRVQFLFVFICAATTTSREQIARNSVRNRCLVAEMPMNESHSLLTPPKF